MEALKAYDHDLQTTIICLRLAKMVGRSLRPCSERRIYIKVHWNVYMALLSIHRSFIGCRLYLLFFLLPLLIDLPTGYWSFFPLSKPHLSLSDKPSMSMPIPETVLQVDQQLPPITEMHMSGRNLGLVTLKRSRFWCPSRRQKLWILNMFWFRTTHGNGHHHSAKWVCWYKFPSHLFYYPLFYIACGKKVGINLVCFPMIDIVSKLGIFNIAPMLGPVFSYLIHGEISGLSLP